MGRKPKTTTTEKATRQRPKKGNLKTEKPLTTSPEVALREEEEALEGVAEERPERDEKPIALRAKEAVREVLETVKRMPYPGVGLRTIAGILRGETRANWLSYIARTESWGAFFPNPLSTVEAFLRELVRAGYLEGTHFTRLTERGQRVLDGQEAPIVRRRLKVVSPKVRPLLWKFLLLRARLVNERKAPGLFKDETMLQLLEKQPTTMQELKQIKGIGDFLLRHLGEEILHLIRSFRDSNAPQAEEAQQEKPKRQRRRKA